MALENSLLSIMNSSDVEAAKRLVVPWSSGAFPPVPNPSEAEGFFPGYFPPVFRTEALASMRQLPNVARVVFDHEGILYTYPSAFEEIVKRQGMNDGLVNVVIGLVPTSVVLANLKGSPISEKGTAFVTPKQFVSLNFFMGNVFGVWPHMSGRMHIAENKPILYFAKPVGNREEEIGVLVPRELLFEAPEMVKIYHS